MPRRRRPEGSVYEVAVDGSDGVRLRLWVNVEPTDDDRFHAMTGVRGGTR